MKTKSWRGKYPRQLKERKNSKNTTKQRNDKQSDTDLS
jgi:hypothetical protein